MSDDGEDLFSALWTDMCCSAALVAFVLTTKDHPDANKIRENFLQNWKKHVNEKWRAEIKRHSQDLREKLKPLGIENFIDEQKEISRMEQVLQQVEVEARRMFRIVEEPR